MTLTPSPPAPWCLGRILVSCALLALPASALAAVPPHPPLSPAQERATFVVADPRLGIHARFNHGGPP